MRENSVPGELARQIRRLVLKHAGRAGLGHIGSALSITDILALLYGKVLRGSGPDDPERDRMVLSKGHAALALYAALVLKKWLPESRLDEYGGDASQLGTHPEHHLTGVDFSTGALGHGLPMACGAALAAKLDGSKRKVYCVLSDAELNEGSVWEAMLFAAHHHLDNLVAILDFNGQQALGRTDDILRMGDPAAKAREFGWKAVTVDGHDEAALQGGLVALGSIDQPGFLVAKTVLGKGVSFMEGTILWHYKSMNAAETERALKEIDDAP